MKKKLIYLTLIFFFLSYCSYSQKSDSLKVISHFSGSIGVTNNGIGLLPSFSLEKPAAVIVLSIGSGKFNFEPEFRFALEGKPWSMIFWCRYRTKVEKFIFNVGIHPALNFRTEVSPVTGDDMIVTRRFLAGELSPNYLVTKNISVGIYYLYSHCVDKSPARNIHYLTLNSNFSNVKITNKYYMRFTPQVYYLTQDENSGFYVSSLIVLARRNFPLSVSSLLNKVIETNIPGTKDFIWNISLVYSFNKFYVRT